MLEHLSQGDIATLLGIAREREQVHGDILPSEAVALLDPAVNTLSAEARAELLALMWIGTGRRNGRKWPLLMTQAMRSLNDGSTTYISTRLRVRYLERALAEVMDQAA